MKRINSSSPAVMFFSISMMLGIAAGAWILAIDGVVAVFNNAPIRGLKSAAQAPLHTPPPPRPCPPRHRITEAQVQALLNSAVPQESREDFLQVANAGCLFNYGSIDEGPLAAIRRLVVIPERKSVLRALLVHADLPGQLMAMCGLFYTDRPKFDRHVRWYASLKDMGIKVGEGCVLEEGTVAEIVTGGSQRFTSRITDGSFCAHMFRGVFGSN